MVLLESCHCHVSHRPGIRREDLQRTPCAERVCIGYAVFRVVDLTGHLIMICHSGLHQSGGVADSEHGTLNGRVTLYST